MVRKKCQSFLPAQHYRIGVYLYNSSFCRSSITNLDELLAGVEYTDTGCSVPWTSTIGTIARKNKLAFGVTEKKEMLGLTRKDLSTIVQGVTQKNLSPALTRQIENMTLAATVQLTRPKPGVFKKE